MGSFILILFANIAVFGGGCFWCVEEAFDQVPGVEKTTSGYMGGSEENPTYEEVSSGETGHFEVVKVDYDPKKVTYEELLSVFWANVDPTDPIGQFCDQGPQYRSVIFFGSEEEEKLAKASKEKGKIRPNFTLIQPAGTFWPAEEYHQNYYQKNPYRYKFYKTLCGREKRLKEIAPLKK